MQEKDLERAREILRKNIMCRQRQGGEKDVWKTTGEKNLKRALICGLLSAG